MAVEPPQVILQLFQDGVDDLQDWLLGTWAMCHSPSPHPTESSAASHSPVQHIRIRSRCLLLLDTLLACLHRIPEGLVRDVWRQGKEEVDNKAQKAGRDDQTALWSPEPARVGHEGHEIPLSSVSAFAVRNRP